MAGTIDELNFKVILNDKDFQKAVERDLKLAQDLNTKLTNILNLKKKLNGETTQQLVNAQKVAQAEQKTAQEVAKTALQQQKVATEVERTRALHGKVTGAIQTTNTTLSRTANIMRDLSQLTGVAFSVVGLRRFFESLVDITGQFEVQRMALRNMLQDVDAAEKIYADLYRFSSESTYRFSELAKYAKQLAAFNIGKDSLLETTKMLGDVASGVGVSMDRIILAYGHVKSSGFLRGIQLRSFAQNGVPILEELAKQFSEIEQRTVSLGEVFDKMMKREIPFEMVEEGFRRMTSEGGKFYKMQEVLAQTLAGQINILKGRWENMLAAIGQANSGPLKDTISSISDLIANYNELGRVIMELVAYWGVYKATVFLVTWASEGLFAATFKLQLALEKVYLRIAANPYAAIAAVVTALLAGLYKLGTQVNHVYKDVDKIHAALNEGLKDFKSTLTAENVELDRLFRKLQLAKQGTDEYASAKKEIETRFGTYIEQLRQEGTDVQNLANIYGDLASKIEDANKQRFLESVQENATTRMKNAVDALQKDFEYTMKLVGKDLSTSEQSDLWNYITGGALYQGDTERYNKLSKIADKGEYRGEYSGPSYQHWFSVTELRQQYAEVMQAYNQTMDDAENEFKRRKKKQDDDAKESTTQLTYKISDIVKGIKAYDKDIKALEEKARTTGLVLDLEKGIDEKQQLENLRTQRKEQTDLYKEILGVDYDKDVKNGETAAERAIKNQISALKSSIAVLEKYKSIYDKVVPIKGDKTESWMVSVLGGSADDYKNIDAQIVSLIADLRKLGDAGNEAADAIEARLGLDAASQLVKDAKAAEQAQKALDKYLTTLRKWESEDFNLGGSGFEYDIRKIISDLNTNVGKVDEKYIQAVRQAEEAHNGNAEAIAKEIEKLKALRDAEKQYLAAKAQESVNKLAESYLKDQYLLHGVSLDNLGNLTFSQLKRLRDELKSISKEALNTMNGISGIEGYLESLGYDIEKLTDEDIESLKDKLPESEIQLVRFIKSINDAGISFDTLNEKIQSAINKGLKQLDEEEMKAVTKLAKYAAKQVLELASAFDELADATQNSNLRDAADSIQRIGDFASSVAQGFQQGGVYGAALGAVVSMVTMILSDVAEGEKSATQAAENARKAEMAYQKMLDDKEISRSKTIFGTNEIAQFKSYTSILKRYGDFLNELRDAFKESHFGEGLIYLNENGELDIEKIEADLESGVLIGDKLKQIISQYKDAKEAIDSTMESLFGDVAMSAADKIVDSWIEAGNAALDYADILDDVAKSYAKMLIQSMIMETFLDPITEDLKNSFTNGDYDNAMALIAGAMDNVANAAPMFEDILSAFDPYFNYADSSNSLGNGIKSITEDTANLLASYINAIRQDVSVMRSLQEKGFASIDVLAGVITPSLADYVQQIAANTANAARHTSDILSRIDDMLCSGPSDGFGLRVYNS